MPRFDARSFRNVVCSLPIVKVASSTTKKELVVHFHNFIAPKFGGIKNVRCKELRRHTTRKILYGFASWS